MTPSRRPLCAFLVLVVGAVADARAQGPVAPIASATSTPATSAATLDESVVPTAPDTVMRGLRTRVDVGARAVGAGLPSPPVRLEVDDVVGDRQDVDVGGVVILGYDRPMGVPLALDLMGDFNIDANPDSPASPWIDDTSQFPRVRLYSAFVGLSFGPAEPALQPFRVNVGRMTELVDSPITYDGLSAAANLRFRGLGVLNAKLWGGLDAPQRLGDDPFSRTSRRFYRESYAYDPDFVSTPGSVSVQRTAITDPILNPVGGLAVDGRFAGVGFVVRHTLMPAQTRWGSAAGGDGGVLVPLQRSTLGANYRFDSEWLTASAGLESQATDFVPRNVTLKGDALTGDGATRVGVVARYQFFEDITAYDGTFRAVNPAQTFVAADADALEQLRGRDQIRHLNFGPPQEHILASLEAERFLSGSFSVLVRGRLRQHLDPADADMFRTNFYEGGAGINWNPGFAIDVGAEVVGGLVDSSNAEQNGRAYDLKAEGVVSYLEPRVWMRTTLLEGRLSNLTEVFVRRSDIQTKQLAANGQWGGALATTTRYDIADAWSVSLRLDGDALSPIDSLNATTYFGALVATSLRF